MKISKHVLGNLRRKCHALSKSVIRYKKFRESRQKQLAEMAPDDTSRSYVTSRVDAYSYRELLDAALLERLKEIIRWCEETALHEKYPGRLELD